MNRLTKVTAAAMLLTLMTAAPALAIYDPSAPPVTDPGVVRILAAPTDGAQPIAAPATGAPVLVTAVKAAHAEPAAILFNGAPLTYDQNPLVQDGTLMVPLRAIVEGAGGTVNWDGETRTVTVRLADRTAIFVIGAGEAEMNQDNVRYLRRNMIRMARAPMLAGGRTLVAADALTSVLGLRERPATVDTLSLVPASAGTQEAAPPTAPAEPQDWIRGGTLKEIRYNFNGSTAILVEGAPMANGEASQTWFTLSADTKITVVENGVEHEGSQQDLATATALKVDVRPTGPLLMSFPARGGAAAIAIYK